MDFEFSPEQEALRQAIFDTCAPFDDQYWMHKDIDGGFPHDFYQAIAQGGWLGIAMPEQYGGAGLGITEATIMMQARKDLTPEQRDLQRAKLVRETLSA